MSKILVTGAGGFIGKAVSQRLFKDYSVRLASRYLNVARPNDLSVDTVLSPDLGSNGNWTEALKEVNVVIHLAALAHLTNNPKANPLTEFRRINAEGTLELARQAVSIGVKRFVFVSSIGVNGNENSIPFTEVDIPDPIEPYAVSKLEAEDGLRQIANRSNMGVVIIRPPLVYGSNAPGNFGSLLRWVKSGVPLPLGAINNKRSFVALDNLVDLIITCLDHPAAANQTFLAGDGEDLSTTELLKRVALALGKPSRLIPVSVGVLQWTASILGKKAMMQRLCGSLQVDISKARNVLGWTPPITVEEGLRRAVADIRQ